MSTMVLQKVKHAPETEAMSSPEPKSEARTEKITRERVLTSIETEKVKLSTRSRRGKPQLHIASYLDVQGMGENEDEAKKNLEVNWKARQDYERSWESRFRAKKNTKSHDRIS